VIAAKEDGMLNGIHPLLRGELLAVLDEMGHGDLLVVADRNFPARSTTERVIDLPGTTAPEALTAILTVFPLDPAEPAVFMTAPDGTPAVQSELAAAVGTTMQSTTLDRYDFYAKARTAYVTVLSGEARPYGNILIAKGVL
jgi:L-fucose mutarotase